MGIALNRADSFKIPSHYLYSISGYLDSIGYVFDTNQIKGDSYYYWHVKYDPVFSGGNRPFYRIDSTSDFLFMYKKHVKGAVHEAYQYLDNERFNYADFYKVKTITGYYFRQREKPKNWSYTSGFIEEWEFANSNDSRNAFHDLTKDGPMPLSIIYFNSLCLAYYKDRYLYTVYSRSDWDEVKLNKVFKEMKKRCK